MILNNPFKFHFCNSVRKMRPKAFSCSCDFNDINKFNLNAGLVEVTLDYF